MYEKNQTGQSKNGTFPQWRHLDSFHKMLRDTTKKNGIVLGRSLQQLIS